jgi:protoporphyrin/coproporphyrin ferrochelatase
MATVNYDAVVLVSFGGPEGPDDVIPFLRNVVRGRDVPDERLAEVAEHYHHFGGVSPINTQCRELLHALRQELGRAGIGLPVYWGNRNWHPYLTDTAADMRRDGVRRALAFVTSPFGSYSSCRQYLEDIAAATTDAGPVIDKIRHYHDHPGYVGPHADAVRAAASTLSDVPADTVRLVFTAHSIPASMEERSGPDGGRYGAQLRETAALVAREAGTGLAWDLVWQSRSGPPGVRWLEPDVNDHLRALAATGVRGVVVSPIGFISDHLEVIWDLDTEALETAQELGLRYVRAGTPGAGPRFVTMVRELIRERIAPSAPRARLGALPVWDACPVDCCRPAPRPSPRS